MSDRFDYRSPYLVEELEKYIHSCCPQHPNLVDFPSPWIKPCAPEVLNFYLKPWSDRNKKSKYQIEFSYDRAAFYPTHKNQLEKDGVESVLSARVNTGSGSIRFLIPDTYNDDIYQLARGSSYKTIFSPRKKSIDAMIDVIKGCCKDWKSYGCYQAREAVQQEVKEIFDDLEFFLVWDKAGKNLFPRIPWVESLNSTIMLGKKNSCFVAIPGGNINIVVEIFNSNFLQLSTYNSKGDLLMEEPEDYVGIEDLFPNLSEWIIKICESMKPRIERSIEVGRDYEKYY